MNATFSGFRFNFELKSSEKTLESQGSYIGFSGIR